MPANWVKCTASTDQRTIVWINLSRAAWIEAHGTFSRVDYAGGGDDFYDVLESPEQIIAWANDNAPGVTGG